MKWILLIPLFFLFACTPPVQSTLLKDREACTEDNGCLKVQQKDIPGDLNITPDVTQTTLNIEKSDSLEVSGSCRDLGRYDNRVIVQVFEGEDESVQPFIDNSASFSCMGSRTADIAPGVNINGTRCFWNTTGSGIVEPTTEFPRCFNGRFSFRVRLGKVLRDGSNALLNYTVRMKLRSANPAGDSPFARVVVTRTLSKPTFTVSRPADANAAAKLRCEINVNPFRGAAVRYELQKVVNATVGIIPAPDPNVYDSAPDPKPVIFADPDFGNSEAGTTVQKYFDEDVIHGVTYSYSVQASDYKYAAAGVREVSGYSEIITCKTPTPIPLGCSCSNITGQPNTCLASVDRAGQNGTSYEWRYKTDTANWPAGDPTGATALLLPGCSLSNVNNCPINNVPPNAHYYISVRAVHPSGYKGDWMPTTIDCAARP